MRTYPVILSLVTFVLASAAVASAQESVQNEKYQMVDSIVYRPAAVVDASLSGKDIFGILPSKDDGAKADVTVNQSLSVAASMKRHIEDNARRPLNGYRVRIFFDNRQTARAESEAALKRFESIYHGISAYRTYANPYFKVTVGDFRTKSEAMELLARIRSSFPSAFVVREHVSYPVVDRNNAFVADTIKVVKPE